MILLNLALIKFHKEDLVLSSNRIISPFKESISNFNISDGWYYIHYKNDNDKIFLQSTFNISIQTKNVISDKWINIYLTEPQALKISKLKNIFLFKDLSINLNNDHQELQLAFPELYNDIQNSNSEQSNSQKNNSEQQYLVFADPSFILPDNVKATPFMKSLGYYLFNGYPPKSIIENPSVKLISHFERPKLLNRWSTSLLQTEKLQFQIDENDHLIGKRPLHLHGLKGEGEILTLMDSGLDYRSCYFYDPNVTMQFNKSMPNHRKIYRYDAVADEFDGESGHGTHVSGIAVGNSLCSNCSGALYNGQAPESKLYFIDAGYVNVPSDLTSDFDLEKILNQMKKVGSSVFSGSWGSDPSKHLGEHYFYEDTITNFPDILFVFGAGNDPKMSQITIPASSKNVIAVSATENAPLIGSNAFKKASLYMKCNDIPEEKVKIYQSTRSLFEILSNDPIPSISPLSHSQFIVVDLDNESDLCGSSILNPDWSTPSIPEPFEPDHLIMYDFIDENTHVFRIRNQSNDKSSQSTSKTNSNSNTNTNTNNKLRKNLTKSKRLLSDSSTSFHTLENDQKNNQYNNNINKAKPTIIKVDNNVSIEISDKVTKYILIITHKNQKMNCRLNTPMIGVSEEMLQCVKQPDSIVKLRPENNKDPYGSSIKRLFRSSGGPNMLGLLKPDVVAPGSSVSSARSRAHPEDPDFPCSSSYLNVKQGTSMAAPAIAGISLLVQQYLHQGYYPYGQRFSGPKLHNSASLAKAIIIQSSRTLSSSKTSDQRPNLEEGFGIPHIDNTLIFDDKYQSPPLSEFGLRMIDKQRLYYKQMRKGSIKIKNNKHPLVITMVWSDPTGYIDSQRPTVVDLDLFIVTPSSHVIYGNQNNHGTEETHSTVERIYIENPEIGEYQIFVKYSYGIDRSVFVDFSLVVNGGFNHLDFETNPSDMEFKIEKKCLPSCGNHGDCYYSTCYCDKGYTGLHCEIPIAVLDPSEKSEVHVPSRTSTYFRIDIPSISDISNLTNLKNNKNNNNQKKSKLRNNHEEFYDNDYSDDDYSDDDYSDDEYEEIKENDKDLYDDSDELSNDEDLHDHSKYLTLRIQLLNYSVQKNRIPHISIGENRAEKFGGFSSLFTRYEEPIVFNIKMSKNNRTEIVLTFYEATHYNDVFRITTSITDHKSKTRLRAPLPIPINMVYTTDERALKTQKRYDLLQTILYVFATLLFGMIILKYSYIYYKNHHKQDLIHEKAN